MQNLVSGSTLKGKIEDNACAENGSFTITGMITGSLEVRNGADVTLRGMVCGDVTTYEGSKLLVSGMINGSLFVKGGLVEVTGMIQKNLINDGGKVVLHAKAKVLGTIQGERQVI